LVSKQDRIKLPEFNQQLHYSHSARATPTCVS
jgi:hypothetical protein